MRFFLTVVDPRTSEHADVAVTADAGNRIGDLARVLQTLMRDAADRTAGALYLSGRPLDPALTLTESPLREGAVVGLDAPVDGSITEIPGLLEVRVTGGPAIGATHPLGAGAGDVGSGDDCWVSVPDPGLATVAARLTVDLSGDCWIEPLAGTILEIEREPVEARVRWSPGEQVTLGSTILELADYVLPDAALQMSADDVTIDYNRPPRILPVPRQTRFRLPAPPQEASRSRLPWLMALLPLAAALALVMITGNTSTLFLALLSPLSMLGNHLVNRRNGRRSYTEQMAEHRTRRAGIEADIREAVRLERRERRHRYPDPAAVAGIATGPRHRLWERRRRDTDYLRLRVGSAVQPSEVTVEDLALEEHRRSSRWSSGDVPVTVPLRECGVVGVAGADGTARALGRWAVVQAAVLHSPDDLHVVVLTEPTGRECWDWARWLPHARPPGASGPAVLIGTDADSVSRRVAELLEMCVHRASVRSEAGEVPAGEPDVLVVLDGSRRLRSLPGVVQLLRAGPAVGIHALCLDDDRRLLPAECQAVVEVTGGGLRVTQAGSDEIAGVRPDFLDPGWCARVARALAPLRDVSDDDEDAVLPASSRLLQVLALEPPAADTILARWRMGGRSTAVVVGESYDGPFEIDLRRDGPHGLIAGTTGAGKSELLQTVVASLAVANRPDAMTFVLVDYKGGSAFGDCVRLPHTVGMVTDLDEHLVRRALESLGAELRRREHLLAAAGAKDIDDYVRAADRDPGRAPLPRLLIVIDEFASMVRDLPDFVTGLVNIAQRGRSLGIHLLLATQRPGGVVSPEIRANTNLRIALRVTDTSESQDVINAPDAARISKSTPGRAYVRLGHASLVPFQAARVGGRRSGRRSADLPDPSVRPLGWADLGRIPEDGPVERRDDRDDVTDLQVLVAAISAAAEAGGIPPQHSPWLPALPESLGVETLRADAGAPYGVDDLPAEQARHTAVVELERFGHLVVAGAPRTGRSQVLRTIAGSLAGTYSTADLHLYGLDCGNGALLAAAELPHCGAVVTRVQVERAVRLIRRLDEEIRRRQAVLAAGGFANLTEQRAAATADGPLAHIVLLLDSWEGFLSSLGELDAGALTDILFRFLREGASCGVHLIVAGDRSVLTGRIATLTEEKIVLRMPDPGDMSLAGISPRDVPQRMAPGRALRAGSGVETQIALLPGEASGPGQAAALVEIGRRTRERDAPVPAAARPFRLGELPAQIAYAEVAALRPAEAGAGWLLFGVGGDQLTAFGPDLAEGVPAFAVGGPPKSGRSTALVAMARSALDAGQQVIILAPRTSPLRDLAGRPGVVAAFTGPDVDAAAFTAALDATTGRALIAVDDAEALRDVAASTELRTILRGGDPRPLGIVYAGDPEDLSAGFSGWLVDARKSRRGALLSPQNRTDGDLVGVRLPRTAVGQPVQPGRALLYLGDAEPTVVQVPR
ncbi:cell division protein FtsK [Actinoplanes sp. SE50]|uniref:FtsK/SpoIIIE domain-containing protein n=1 Tax=unclassified Actinoplanes TaxID=2626549 RepID=UPI00023EBD41|nr:MULTISPECIES: FtsK/SpoIIIE domain-containing protein [unclassified Actinoplanes]AEV84530.1 Protein essC [Actinoplanes sp. SE50/110]ATO82922.1 cell division protein FtsK [Actinoplanes sp. SE50]SLM00330.1 cell division protein FtsK [Actinoplanes sp. SE50/110]